MTKTFKIIAAYRAQPIQSYIGIFFKFLCSHAIARIQRQRKQNLRIVCNPSLLRTFFKRLPKRASSEMYSETTENSKLRPISTQGIPQDQTGNKICRSSILTLRLKHYKIKLLDITNMKFQEKCLTPQSITMPSLEICWQSSTSRRTSTRY